MRSCMLFEILKVAVFAAMKNRMRYFLANFKLFAFLCVYFHYISPPFSSIHIPKIQIMNPNKNKNL